MYYGFPKRQVAHPLRGMVRVFRGFEGNKIAHMRPTMRFGAAPKRGNLVLYGLSQLVHVTIGSYVVL